jgi:hypothetical protein
MFKGEKDIRDQLIRELSMRRVFWSYKNPEPDSIPDEILIEKALINLDIDDINKLFLIFPKPKIKNVWNNKIVINDSQFHSMNILIAGLYFNIKNPESYLERCIEKHYKQ